MQDDSSSKTPLELSQKDENFQQPLRIFDSYWSRRKTWPLLKDDSPLVKKLYEQGIQVLNELGTKITQQRRINVGDYRNKLTLNSLGCLRNVHKDHLADDLLKRYESLINTARLCGLLTE